MSSAGEDQIPVGIAAFRERMDVMQRESAGALSAQEISEFALAVPRKRPPGARIVKRGRHNVSLPTTVPTPHDDREETLGVEEETPLEPVPSYPPA